MKSMLDVDTTNWTYSLNKQDQQKHIESEIQTVGNWTIR